MALLCHSESLGCGRLPVLVGVCFVELRCPLFFSYTTAVARTPPEGNVFPCMETNPRFGVGFTVRVFWYWIGDAHITGERMRPTRAPVKEFVYSTRRVGHWLNSLPRLDTFRMHLVSQTTVA